MSSHPLVLLDGAVRFRGFREGRYTLLVDLDGFVPVVLRARALEGRDVDLGIIELDHGSSIRILVPDGAVRPLSIRAFMLDAPRYLRAGDGNVLAGLGKGRYRVVVAQRPGAHKALPLLDRIVEVDGEHDVELELR